MHPHSYPISAPLAKLGLRADDALPPGATKSSDGTKVTLIYGSVEGSHGGHGFKVKRVAFLSSWSKAA
jgi:hypothetical protein